MMRPKNATFYIASLSDILEETVDKLESSKPYVNQYRMDEWFKVVMYCAIQMEWEIGWLDELNQVSGQFMLLLIGQTLPQS